MSFRVIHSDCVEALRGMEGASIDAICTDPPYELGFMGKRWDASGIAYSLDLWREALRVLKPGGHLCAFGGTRTYHRMACAIEDAGFEIRDSLHWIYTTGFPKSLDVSKAIDKRREDGGDVLRVTSWLADAAERAGVSRADVDEHMGTSDMGGWWLSHLSHRCALPTWDQWLRLKDLVRCGDEMDAEVQRLNARKGTLGEAALQRGFIEPTGGLHGGTGVTVGCFTGRQLAPEPFREDAATWSGWGTALKPAHEPVILARRPFPRTVAENVLSFGTGALNVRACRVEGDRWPPNIVIDDRIAPDLVPFFYVPKPSRAERDVGLDDLPERSGGDATDREDGSDGLKSPRAGAGRNGGARNIHPTVKPVALMEWLVRLVTPPGGTVLDPFLGSGTTGCAAVRLGFDFIGIEREAEYVEIAERRIRLALNAPRSKPLGSLERCEDAAPGQVDMFAAGALSRGGTT